MLKTYFYKNLTSISDCWRLSEEDTSFLIMIKMYTLHSQSQHVYTIYISIKFKDSIWIYDFVIHMNIKARNTFSKAHIRLLQYKLLNPVEWNKRISK